VVSIPSGPFDFAALAQDDERGGGMNKGITAIA
jgi:hypothetical protein